MNEKPSALIRTLTFAGVIPFVMAPMMKVGWIAGSVSADFLIIEVHFVDSFTSLLTTTPAFFPMISSWSVLCC